MYKLLTHFTKYSTGFDTGTDMEISLHHGYELMVYSPVRYKISLRRRYPFINHAEGTEGPWALSVNSEPLETSVKDERSAREVRIEEVERGEGRGLKAVNRVIRFLAILNGTWCSSYSFDLASGPPI